jgi:hypothetical protein
MESTRKIEQFNQAGRRFWILADKQGATAGSLDVVKKTEKKGIWPFRKAQYEVTFLTLAENQQDHQPRFDEPVKLDKKVIFDGEQFRSDKAAARKAIKKLNLSRE